MKSKLPFTEKFLWDLYNFINKTGNITRKILKEIIPEHAHHKSRATTELMFPNFAVYRDVWEDNYKKKDRDKRFVKIVQYLKEKGYLKTLKIKGEDAAIITTKGIDKLFKIQLKISDRGTRKDGKWQMVLFDIPENKRKERDRFRRGLQYLGYKRFQKSIWVCSNDVLNETKELIERHGLEQFVELLLVEKISFG